MVAHEVLAVLCQSFCAKYWLLIAEKFDPVEESLALHSDDRKFCHVLRVKNYLYRRVLLSMRDLLQRRCLRHLHLQADLEAECT